MILKYLRVFLALYFAVLPFKVLANMPGVGLFISDTSTPNGPNTYFKVVQYTGNASTQAITGLGFSPTFVIIKSIPLLSEWQGFDNLRGNTLAWRMTTTGFGQFSSASRFLSFDADGFTVGNDTNTNGSGTVYMALAFRGGSSQFWMERYTGNNNNSTLRSHGLGVLPFMIWARDTAQAADTPMNGLAAAIPSTAGMFMNGRSVSTYYTAGASTSSSVYNPSITTYSNNSGTSYNMGYLFGAQSGYSAAGFYAGNGSATGPTITTGFQPSWIMLQKTDGSGSLAMVFKLRNPSNPAINSQRLNATTAEVTSDVNLDFLTTGFQIKSATLFNTSGQPYFWMAYK